MIDEPWWEQRRLHFVLALLATVPLLYPAVPVWGDMPAHLAMYRVALEHGQPGSPLGQFYAYAWKIQGNMGVDLLVMPLARLFPLEMAAKLILIFTMALTVFGILALSREVHGRTSPLALFAVPLAYGFTFQFGMANYCLSMALALCGFALWLKWGRLGRGALRALVFLVGSPLLWMCHIYGWAVLCVLCGMTEISRNLKRGDGLVAGFWHAMLTCAVLALPLAATLIWRSGGSEFASGWFDFEEKISFMLHTLSAVWPMGNVKSIIIKISVLLLLGFVMLRQRRWRLQPQMRLAVATLLVLFLLLPTVLFSSYAADGRLLPYIVILSLLSLEITGPADEVRRRRLASWGLGFTLVQFTALTLSFAATAKAQEQRLRVLNELPMGARLVTLIGGGSFCDDHEYNRVMNHLPSMAIVRRRAFGNDQFQNDQLMRVIYPPTPHGTPGHALRDYYHDESQLVSNPRCRHSPIDTALVNMRGNNLAANDYARRQDPHSIEYTLANLPRDSFDYVWLIAPPSFDPGLLHGMTRIAAVGDSSLYRIDNRGK